MLNITAAPGEKITVDVDPDAWPFRIQIGDGPALPAMPERYKARRGEVKARATIQLPQLGAGAHKITVHDRNGAHAAGTVRVV